MKIALFSYTDFGFKAAEVLLSMGHQLVGVLPTNRDSAALDEARSFYRTRGIDFAEDAGGERQKELGSFLAEREAEFGLVVGHSRLIRPAVLAVLRRGCLNVHPGLLPQFRGQHVINWAVISGARATALALHIVAEKIDAGPVLAQRPVELSPRETATSLNAKLLSELEPLLRLALPAYLSGDLAPQPQDESLAGYWKPRTPEDGEIRPSMRRAQIDALVRGLSRPWPGAWIEHAGVRWHIFGCEPSIAAVPAQGPILEWRPEAGLLLRTADGILRLNDVEVDRAPAGPELLKTLERCL